MPADRAAFRLIIAAQSWHWVSPEVRCRKAAEALSRDGSLAVFGHVPMGLPAPLLDQFKENYLRRIGKWGPPPEAWYLPNGPFKDWFTQSGLFEPAEHRRYLRKWRHTASSYADSLRTRSDHGMMEPAKRDELLADIAHAINSRGGQFDVDYETHLLSLAALIAIDQPSEAADTTAARQSPRSRKNLSRSRRPPSSIRAKEAAS